MPSASTFEEKHLIFLSAVWCLAAICRTKESVQMRGFQWFCVAAKHKGSTVMPAANGDKIRLKEIYWSLLLPNPCAYEIESSPQTPAWAAPTEISFHFWHKCFHDRCVFLRFHTLSSGSSLPPVVFTSLMSQSNSLSSSHLQTLQLDLKWEPLVALIRNWVFKREQYWLPSAEVSGAVCCEIDCS